MLSNFVIKISLECHRNTGSNIPHLASTDNVYFILLFMLDSIRGSKGRQEC